MITTRYRILQIKNEQGEWQDRGAAYETRFHDSPLVVVPILSPAHTKVHWREWNDIVARERELGAMGPPLEEYDQLFVAHSDQYRLSRRIYTIEGQSYKEISKQLYERYVLSSRQTESTSRQASQALTYEPVLAEGRTLRESDADKPGS